MPVEELDDRHLLGEHSELHAMANALIRGGGAWYNHPATQFFRGKLGALYRRHEEQVAEMRRRGWSGHRSDFPVEKIPTDEIKAVIEITPDLVERDRRELAKRKRLAEGGSWRTAGGAPEEGERGHKPRAV